MSNDIITTHADQLPRQRDVQEAQCIDDALRQNLDVYFRFKVGDLVVCKANLEPYRLDAEINTMKGFERVNVLASMQIVERLLQQCHGGIQGFYVVRRWSLTDGGGSQEVMVKFIEHEIVSWHEVADVARAVAEKVNAKKT